MKYRLKHAVAKADVVQDDGMVMVRDLQPCWFCYYVTGWVDTYMGAFICSEECRVRLHMTAGQGETDWLDDHKKKAAEACGIVVPDDYSDVPFI
jgi:hypothetical protein